MVSEKPGLMLTIKIKDNANQPQMVTKTKILIILTCKIPFVFTNRKKQCNSAISHKCKIYYPPTASISIFIKGITFSFFLLILWLVIAYSFGYHCKHFQYLRNTLFMIGTFSCQPKLLFVFLLQLIISYKQTLLTNCLTVTI